MSVEEQEFLRNDLTVKPFVPKNSIIYLFIIILRVSYRYCKYAYGHKEKP